MSGDRTVELGPTLHVLRVLSENERWLNTYEMLPSLGEMEFVDLDADDIRLLGREADAVLAKDPPVDLRAILKRVSAFCRGEDVDGD
jgi:hypothetical protein